MYVSFIIHDFILAQGCLELSVKYYRLSRLERNFKNHLFQACPPTHYLFEAICSVLGE